MKKVKLELKDLQLKKERVQGLDQNTLEHLKGGAYTDGCTDGCTPLGTVWNCTSADCSANCSSSFCPATNTGQPGTMC